MKENATNWWPCLYVLKWELGSSTVVANTVLCFNVRHVTVSVNVLNYTVQLLYTVWTILWTHLDHFNISSWQLSMDHGMARKYFSKWKILEPSLMLSQQRALTDFSGLGHQWAEFSPNDIPFECMLLTNLLCLHKIVSTDAGCTIYLLSRSSRSLLSSSNGFPSSSITSMSKQTSFLNAFCTLAVWA